MASSFEKSIKGATKYKVAPPKSKYIEHILTATHSGESGVAEIFRTLQYRLRDSTWTIVLKSLITIHLMIREGSPNVTLAYLSRYRNMLAISNFSDVQTQGKNIRHYTNYLNERAKAFRETKCDFVKGATSRLDRLPVEKGLLRETEIVQRQITTLLKCDVLDNEPENEITITVFRLLVLDLLSLFHIMNTGLINILGHFFEMSKTDAERALDIYKNFTKQTDHVVQYLSVARQFEYQTRVEVPKLKHAPVNLGKQLEDYVKDPEFEANRMQYLKEQEAKNSRTTNSKTFFSKSVFQSRADASCNTSSRPTNEKISNPINRPDQNLIDFFESIEQDQQDTSQPELKQDTFQINNLVNLQTQQHQIYQSNSLVPQQMKFPDQNQLTQMSNNQVVIQQNLQSSLPSFINEANEYKHQFSFQPNDLSAVLQNQSMTSYPSPIPQQQIEIPQIAKFQTTNPFRQPVNINNSQVAPSLIQTSISPISPSASHLSTNPFALSAGSSSHPYSPPPDQNFQQILSQSQTLSIGSIASGKNPFTKSISNPTINIGQISQGSEGQTQQLGNTNPFRQSKYLHDTTESSWPSKQQQIGGGLDELNTIPVFPRPMQQQAWPY